MIDARWLGIVQTLLALGAGGCVVWRLTSDLTIEHLAHARSLGTRNPALGSVWRRLCAVNRRGSLVRVLVLAFILGRGPLSVATIFARPHLSPVERLAADYQALGLTGLAVVLLAAGLLDFRDGRAIRAALRAERRAEAAARVTAGRRAVRVRARAAASSPVEERPDG